MTWPVLHRWDLEPAEAVELQRSLAAEVVLAGSVADAATVAGLDVAYDPSSDRLAAAVVVLSVESMDPVDEAVVLTRAQVDYRPGLFAFRELPALLDALERLSSQPDLLVCDGNGLAHPERFGLACHAGLWTGIPSIGCAKSPFTGLTVEPVGDERGDRADLVDREEVVGVVLRTRAEVKPVYVSPGHRIGIGAAADWVLRLAPRFRLPEPIRAADHLARQTLKSS